MVLFLKTRLLQISLMAAEPLYWAFGLAGLADHATSLSHSSARADQGPGVSRGKRGRLTSILLLAWWSVQLTALYGESHTSPELDWPVLITVCQRRQAMASKLQS